MNIESKLDGGKYIPEIFDIVEIDLLFQGKHSLNNPHPCVVYKKIGSNYRIVPITSDRKKLHWCEYPIEKGRCNLKYDSKLKLDQIKNVSEELIIGKEKIGVADIEIRKAISDYLIKEANEIVTEISKNKCYPRLNTIKLTSPNS